MKMLKRMEEVVEANILPFFLGMMFGMFIILMRIS